MGACLVPGGILSLDQGNLLFSLSPLEGFIANLSVQRQFFPTDEDETGAAKALMRLQDTYKLDPDTISKGELPGNSPLQTKPVQHVCLLWCMDKDEATADSWSLCSGSPRPLAVVLSWVSSWCQSSIPMTAVSPQPLPHHLPPVLAQACPLSAQRMPRLLLRTSLVRVPRAPLRSASTPTSIPHPPISSCLRLISGLIAPCPVCPQLQSLSLFILCPPLWTLPPELTHMLCSCSSYKPLPQDPRPF